MPPNGSISPIEIYVRSFIDDSPATATATAEEDFIRSTHLNECVRLLSESLQSLKKQNPTWKSQIVDGEKPIIDKLVAKSIKFSSKFHDALVFECLKRLDQLLIATSLPVLLLLMIQLLTHLDNTFNNLTDYLQAATDDYQYEVDLSFLDKKQSFLGDFINLIKKSWEDIIRSLSGTLNGFSKIFSSHNNRLIPDKHMLKYLFISRKLTKNELFPFLASHFLQEDYKKFQISSALLETLLAEFEERMNESAEANNEIDQEFITMFNAEFNKGQLRYFSWFGKRKYFTNAHEISEALADADDMKEHQIYSACEKVAQQLSKESSGDPMILHEWKTIMDDYPDPHEYIRLLCIARAQGNPDRFSPNEQAQYNQLKDDVLKFQFLTPASPPSRHALNAEQLNH